MRKELLPGEQVIVITRRQPGMLVAPALVFILVPALTAYACAWIVKGGPARLLPVINSAWTPWLVTACVAVGALIVLAYGLPRYLRWRGMRYILTSRRIIARYGMLRRRDWQVSLAAIRNVGVHQSMLQRIFRSGNISLDTGHTNGAVMAGVPEANTFRVFILDAIDELPDGEIFGGDGIEDFADTELPRTLREGGRDER